MHAIIANASVALLRVRHSAKNFLALLAAIKCRRPLIMWYRYICSRFCLKCSGKR